MSDDQQIEPQVQAAAQAYIYGYPLVYNMKEIGGFVSRGGSLPVSAPFNEFGHARELVAHVPYRGLEFLAVFTRLLALG